MKIIYGNIIWFSVIVYGLIVAGIQRHNSVQWASTPGIRMNYDVMFGFLALWLVVTIIGLIYKKMWAYAFALSSNATVAGISLGALCVTLIIGLPDLSIFEILKINSKNLVAGFISLCLFIWLLKSKKQYKEKYEL